MASLSSTPRTFTHRTTMVGRLKEIAAHRELLLNLVRLELKAKYKASALGFAWSLLNPAMYLVVFYIAFDVILGSGIPRFPIYLLSGLLVWNFFTTALNTGTGSVVAGAGLVKKVWFPREILPLASVGAALVHFFLQLLVLVAALIAVRHPVGWAELPLLPLALVDLILLAAGLVPAVLGGQRLPAGHGPLRRTGADGLVLGDTDRLPLHPTEGGARRSHHRRPDQPGDADRPHLPAALYGDFGTPPVIPPTSTSPGTSGT